ncbi:excisionase family DNA-binding protein [Mycolicibacterium hippocampi]|uniref:Helix-turn-helix domain-containing protein n=1 Tax=Mycolicibacterium hippocampi TaxID=659824 RepID=A0A7I9ZVG2_9MYCO|nr:excisionase family DNA-binding protein [Mycolicibacterium hippocampi]GFH05041.1 hypothetical protein MHIP_55240 [Mycolicibacterium hippocampi]
MHNIKPRPAIPARLGVVDAAKYANVAECTIRRWIREGRLKANRIGPKLIQIDKAELDKIIEPIGGAAS